MFIYHGETYTNAEDFDETFQIVTAGVDITGWAIDCTITSPDGQKYPATVTKDIPNGAFRVQLPAATMANFCTGSATLACRYTLNGETTQIIKGTFSVMDGGF